MPEPRALPSSSFRRRFQRRKMAIHFRELPKAHSVNHSLRPRRGQLRRDFQQLQHISLRPLFELLPRIHNGKVNWLAYSVGWDARHVS